MKMPTIAELKNNETMKQCYGSELDKLSDANIVVNYIMSELPETVDDVHVARQLVEMHVTFPYKVDDLFTLVICNDPVELLATCYLYFLSESFSKEDAKMQEKRIIQLMLNTGIPKSPYFDEYDD